ncbi:HAD family hydrolase [Nitrosopumilus maritimus]|uniref:Haloacid dehalogenase domain protein hydrolase n=1 Tax=Nitrosopumilus maritimus (strain SCM1) TaxID=436308 RepID=A9A5X4_NITMS|nr:HAD-IA family hydrolase [Nitrosopumilus maritimus]ABX13452.1 Haloacid dehalogenase domain protein hydrolase [Nitrosopumilus maritimus SCM1]
MDSQKFDSIIFDCDGVLVDITQSYDKTIDKTCRYVLKEFAKIDSITIDHKIIDGFKSSGGFNDEVDLVYAAILSLYTANKLNKKPSEFIYDVISNTDKTGIRSVQSYLESIYDVSEFLSKLGSLGDRHNNPVYSIFDQFFFGPELYGKLFDKQSKFSEEGMISNDKVILSVSLLETLQKEFGKKIAVVTGRGIESIRYSLKDMMDYFDTKNSAFLEDEPRELAKPNPATLIRAIQSMESKNCLYVGDSMEDYMMAKDAAQAGHSTTFCAIVGTSTNPEDRRKLFADSGVEMILESINDIPKVLNLV